MHSQIAGFLGQLSAEEKKGSLTFLPKFHHFHSQEVPRIWDSHLKGIIQEFDHILKQRAALEHALMILKSLNSEYYHRYGVISVCAIFPVLSVCLDVSCYVQSILDAVTTAPDFFKSKEERRTNLSREEENAIRYSAGYIVRKFKKRYEDKGPVEVVHCLLSMEEGTEIDNDNGSEYSFEEYTKIWVNLVDRGGLFKANEVAFSFLHELELSIYPLLRSSVDLGTRCSKEDVSKHMLSDKDVLFAWALVSVHLDNHHSTKLLSEVALHWVQIRGFSMVSWLLEDYKCATKTSTKAKKSLRKELQAKDL